MANKQKIEVLNVSHGKAGLYHKDSPYYVIKDPTYAHPDAVPVEIFPVNEENVNKVLYEPDDFAVALVENQKVNNIVVVGNTNNLSGQIKNLVNQRSGGPYYLDGRDGILTIHNKKIERPVSKIYTYAGGNGELLDFNVASKYTTTTVSVARGSGIDPDTKSQENLQTQVVSTGEFADGDRGYMLFSDKEYFDISRSPLDGQWRFLNPFSNSGVFLKHVTGSTMISGEDGIYYRGKRYGERTVKSNKINTPNTGRKDSNTQSIDYEVINHLQSTRMIYDSRTEALSRSKDINQVTAKEVEDYIKLLEEHGKILKGEIPADWTSWSKEEREEWWDNHHHLTVLPPFKIKREVFYMVTTYITNTFTISDRDKANLPGEGHISSREVNRLSVANQNDVKKLLKALGKTVAKDVKILAIDDSSPISVDKYDEVSTNNTRLIYLYVKELIELNLNGVEVLAGSTIVGDIVNSSWVEQDLLKKTTDAVRANATILGDPSIESSMNIQIQNVSSRYSGVWYTKKVIHKFSDGEGYVMDIEFEKRDIPVKTIKIHSRTNSASKLISWSDAAKEKYNSGTWDLTNRLSIEIDTLKAKYPKYPTTIYIQDKNDPTKFTVYMAKEDMSTAQLDESVKSGNLSDITVEYIDLKDTRLSEDEII